MPAKDKLDGETKSPRISTGKSGSECQLWKTTTSPFSIEDLVIWAEVRGDCSTMKSRTSEAKLLTIAVLILILQASFPPKADGTSSEKHAQSSRLGDGGGGDGDNAAAVNSLGQ